jgi:hypothetical protein
MLGGANQSAQANATESSSGKAKSGLAQIAAFLRNF